MKYWIIPSNSQKFDMEAALRANGGLLDWRIKNVSEGDMVFMYKTMPAGYIKYMMEVVKTNVPISERLNQRRFWKDIIMLNNGDGIYARLKQIEHFDEKRLSIHNLRLHGINGNIQSKRVCHKETLEYILNE